MECPYCKQEMKTGYIKGDGRWKLRWREKGKVHTFADTLAGIGFPKAVKYSWWKFQIPGEYCKSCKKLIIDTEISE